jgi:hypothetical protein
VAGRERDARRADPAGQPGLDAGFHGPRAVATADAERDRPRDPRGTPATRRSP